MDALRVVSSVLGSALAAVLRRLLRGPRHPGWSWSLELSAGAMRGSFRQIARLGAERYRRATDRLAPVVTGGVPCRAIDDGPLVGHWLEPEGASDRVIVYLHGGGFAFGSIRTHGNLAGHLAKACDARVFFPRLPLAPEHPLPAARDHVVAAIAALVAGGADPGRLVLAGDSAGGNLVFTVLMALRDADGPRLAGGVAISPWTDLSQSGASFETWKDVDYCTREACDAAARWALGGRDARDPLASPLYADLSGLPPILVHAGGAECLVDQIVALGDRAQEVGADVELVVAPGMVHVWHLLVGTIPEADASIADIAAWVRRRAPT